MKSFFFNIFHNFGESIHYFANGVIGGFIWSIYKKLSFKEAARQILIGGVVSAYVTPVMIPRVSITYVGFISFTVGMVGIVILDSIYKWAVKKIKLLF